MKPAVIEKLAPSDRLATWNEIRSTISLPSQDVFELHYDSDGYCEMKSDIYGWVRILNEDLELAIARGNFEAQR